MIPALLRRLSEWQAGNNNPGQPHPGIKPAAHKTLSSEHPVQQLIPEAGCELVIPLQQHSGGKPELLVKPGDQVRKGQVLARASGEFSVPIHASTGGTIMAIEPRPVAHPSGLSDDCIILRAAGEDQQEPAWLPALADYQQYDGATLRQRISEAGIVGLGGAVFPSAIKLRVRAGIPICTLVINGAECEPYISCDDRLMRDQAAEIIAGAQIMLHILASHAPADATVACLIGIEDNKPEAIRAMQAAITAAQDEQLRVVVIPTLYPAGGEKQLIHTLTGREVPSGGRPADVGVICHNVATSRAIYRAVVLGEPLISRYVTVTGDGVADPQNMDVPLGMPVSQLIAAAGGYQGETGQRLMGGPMMGIPLTDDTIPVVKATNCILINTPATLPTEQATLPCIRCGKCAEHCPAQLLPQQLYWYARDKDFAKAERYHLFDCIECGCCSYVCPSHIPLVSYYRFAKAEIREQRVARQKAELARERHDFHLERLERAKRERAEKLAEHKQQAVATDKKNAIQAALERAKAKKAQLVAQQAEQTEATPPAPASPPAESPAEERK